MISRALQVAYKLKTNFEKSQFIKPIQSLYQIGNYLVIQELFKFIVIWLKETFRCWNQSLKIPKETGKSTSMINTSENKLQDDFNLSQESSSEDEVVIQSSQFIQPSRSQMQAMQQMYMPYVEGPKLNWTVNDCLYHILL